MSAQHIPAAIKAIEPLINHYGYYAVAGAIFLEDFGTVFIPGESVLIAASFYAGLGQLNIAVVAIIGFIAAIAGDNLGFAIGDFGGRPVVERWGKYVLLTPKRLDRAEHFFNRFGGRIVVVARFVDGLRQLNGIMAGISEMRWLRFIIFNAIGAALWVTTWTMIGYFGGSHISIFLHFELYFTIAIFGLIFGRMFYKRYIKKETD